MGFSWQPRQTEVKYYLLLQFVLWIQRSWNVVAWDLQLFYSKILIELCSAVLWETTDQFNIGDYAIQLAQVIPK